MLDPLNHPFFTKTKIEALTSANFDEQVAKYPEQIVGVFFWGHQCPNCEIAKNQLHEESERLETLGFKWFHVNVYENFDLGTRFALHGIPAFFFLRNGQRLGKISPFPGTAAFFEALEKLKAAGA